MINKSLLDYTYQLIMIVFSNLTNFSNTFGFIRSDFFFVVNTHVNMFLNLFMFYLPCSSLRQPRAAHS